MEFSTARLKTVEPSASAMPRADPDIIDLGLGEPDFYTPTHIIKATHIDGTSSIIRR